MTADDPEGRRQPEAGSLSLGLAGEKRFENPTDSIRGDSRAGIRRQQPDVPARINTLAQEGSGFGQSDVFGGKGEGAAVGHRIPGVDGEIEQHLVQLRGVGLHGPEIGRDILRNEDVLGKGLSGVFVYEATGIALNGCKWLTP